MTTTSRDGLLSVFPGRLDLKQLGIKTLILVTMFSSGATVAFADLTSNDVTFDALSERMTSQSDIISWEPAGFFNAKADGFFHTSDLFIVVDNPALARWVSSLAASYREPAKNYLNDLPAQEGVVDKGGAIATINDPTGGGSLRIGINSFGQIVGPIDYHRASPGDPPVVQANEPSALPLLAGLLPILVVLAIRKARPRNRNRRIVYSSDGSEEKRTTRGISTGPDRSASSAS